LIHVQKLSFVAKGWGTRWVLHYQLVNGVQGRFVLALVVLLSSFLD
jgi:hypothetical protein